MQYSFFHKTLEGISFIECRGNPQDPVIIFSHGYGANAENLLFLTSVCSFQGIRPTWIFPQGIEALPQGGRAWFPLDIDLFQELIQTPTLSEETLEKYQQLFGVGLEKPKKALEKLITALNIPTSQIILGGFSQGAMLTTHTILSASTPYMGALICSGAFIFNHHWETNILRCPKTPFLQSHGMNDDILPCFLGQQLYELLSQQLKGEWVSFPGGHEIPSSVLHKIEENVIAWSQSNL